MRKTSSRRSIRSHPGQNGRSVKKFRSQNVQIFGYVHQKHKCPKYVYLGCTQRECHTWKDIVDNYRNMFESRISAWAIEKLPSIEKPDANISSWSYDVEGHAKKCVERHCELAKNNSTAFQSRNTMHWRPPIQGRRNRIYWRIVKSLLTDFLKCQHLTRIGRPDILWSVNKLAGAITEWTRACDKRLARLISYIHHTCEFNQRCHEGNTAQQCRLGLFQDSDFAGDLVDTKSTSGGLLCIFRKSHVRANKLDVQEKDFSFTQFYRSWNNFSRCRFYAWMEFQLLIFGIW